MLAGQSFLTIFLFFAQVPRQRMQRVLLKDVIFVMEQEKETTKSLLLYKALRQALLK